jgi:hypothetical protein
VYTDFTRRNWVHLPIDPEAGIVCKFGEAKRKIPLPSSFGHVGYVSAGRGQIWAVGIRELDEDIDCVLYACPCDPKAGTWQRVAAIDPSCGIPSILLPLSDPTRFIGISHSLGFAKQDEKTASPIGIFRLRNETLEYERDLEIPFGDREHIGRKAEWKSAPEDMPAGKELSPEATKLLYCEITPKGLAPTLWLPSLSKDYLAITSATAGVIWIYSLDTGRLKRMINLCGLDEKSIPKTERLRWIIMGTAFSPDGRLIVASRPPDMVEFTVALEDSKDDPKGKREVFDAMAEKFKDFQWWEIDPDEGTTRKIENPIDYPAGTSSFDRQACTRFLIDESGKVRTTAISSWKNILQQSGAEPPVDPAKKVGKDEKAGSKDGATSAAKIPVPPQEAAGQTVPQPDPPTQPKADPAKTNPTGK